MVGLAGFGAGIAFAWLQYQHNRQLLQPVLYAAGGVATLIVCLVLSEVLAMLRDMAINSFDSSDTGLSSLEMETVLSNAIRHTTPGPTDNAAMLTRRKSSRSRRVICSECGKKIKIPSTSKYKPGDTAKCPGCKSRIVV